MKESRVCATHGQSPDWTWRGKHRVFIGCVLAFSHCSITDEWVKRESNCEIFPKTICLTSHHMILQGVTVVVHSWVLMSAHASTNALHGNLTQGKSGRGGNIDILCYTEILNGPSRCLNASFKFKLKAGAWLQLWCCLVGNNSGSNWSLELVCRPSERGETVWKGRASGRRHYGHHHALRKASAKVEGTSEMGTYTARLKPLQACASAVVGFSQWPTGRSHGDSLRLPGKDP